MTASNTASGTECQAELRTEMANYRQTYDAILVFDLVRAGCSRSAWSAGVISGAVHLVSAPPEIQVRTPEPQRPSIVKKSFDPDSDHPSDLCRTLPKGIVGVYPAWHVPAKIDVGYGIGNVSHRQPTSGK